MATITAVKPKNQGKVNKTVKALNTYYRLNDLRDAADGRGESLTPHNRLCEAAFDKYLTYRLELPKYERDNIQKQLN